MMSYRGKAPERAIILEGRILVWLEQRVAGEASADDAGGTGQHQFQTTGQKKERGGSIYKIYGLTTCINHKPL
jgi:hypothetical protein